MIYEIEARLYSTFGNKLFVSFLKNYYSKYFQETIEDTVYIFPDKVRYIETTDTWIKKEVIKEKKFDNRKISVSVESFKDVTKHDIDSAVMKRTRIRDYYLLPSGLSLQITKINNINYEVEVELETKEFNDDIEKLFHKKFNSFYSELETYNNCFNNFLFHFNGKRNTDYMFKDVIAKPRDIEKIDFITKKGKGLPEGYTIAIKADGIPVILYFYDKYLFKISIGISFTLVGESSVSSREEFMIIGELIKTHDAEIFSPFDILHWSRQENIRNHPNHLERLANAYKILTRHSELVNKYFIVYQKDFIPIGKTPESFAKAYKKIISTEYPFENDGMILTPIFQPQNVVNKNFNRLTRISELPQVLKIKPWEKLSIDFTVDTVAKKVFTSGDSKEYKGTDRHPFDSLVNIDWDTIPKELNMKIVEVAPLKTEVIKMYFTRERTDKIKPNHKSTVDNVWNHINDPIQKSVYLAKDIFRLRIQNNTIKKNIISSIPKKSIVVDIGTGNGGDIMKYNGIAEVVICVEPDKTNLIELKKRLNQMRPMLTTKFEILECGGESHEKIMETFSIIKNSYPENPVAVVSMLSMTFFWKNVKLLDLFKKTLKSISSYSSGAMFYFYTIEGTRFLNYLKENDNAIKTSSIKALYRPEKNKYGVSIPGEVKIQISDTIVRLQTEYLVCLKDLEDTVKDIEISEGIIEEYLSVDEFNYGKCHVYGSGKIVNS